MLDKLQNVVNQIVEAETELNVIENELPMLEKNRLDEVIKIAKKRDCV